MATRLTIQTRRQTLYDALARSCCDGTYAPGAMLPPVRELGEQHGVSASVVFGVIQGLTDEGLVYTVPRVGAFVGRPRGQAVEPFLMIIPYRDRDDHGFWAQAQTGFEERITQLGGSSIVLLKAEALIHLHDQALPPLAGVFDIRPFSHSDLLRELGEPYVCFDNPQGGLACDTISFDDVAGGARATRHLWENGHRRIAFLGLHQAQDVGEFAWSALRQQGWQSALSGQPRGKELLFLPTQKVEGSMGDAQIILARQAAQGLIGRRDITAVVAVNSYAMQGMFEAFRAASWPAKDWPAVVCFDEAAGAESSVVSYLRLPWEEIGREAAQLLWERQNGRLNGAPTQRLVAMRLIARLSCRADWAQNSKLVGPNLGYEAESFAASARERREGVAA